MMGSALSSYIGTLTGDRTAILRVALIVIALLAVYLTFVPESLRRKPAPLAFLVADHSEDRHGAAESTAHQSIAWRIVNFVKEGTTMVLDPVKVFFPGRIAKSANMATTATPLLVLFAQFLGNVGDSGNYPTQFGPSIHSGSIRTWDSNLFCLCFNIANAC